LEYEKSYQVLEKFNLYFRELSENGKSKFLERITVLQSEINVYGKDMDVSPEIKLIILSYFVQLTFGLENYFIGDFDTIYLYEKEFTSERSSKTKIGQTYHSKIIALSWYHFSESHLKVNDGDNLGYYHVGQAMVQSLKNGKSTDDIFMGYYKTAAEIIFNELNQNKTLTFYINNQNLILEKDFDTLFPVLTELFFEKPLDLSKTLPDTYTRLCILFNQDPLAFENDYQLDKNKYRSKRNVSPIPDKIKKVYHYYTSHWSHNLPLINIIIIPVFFIYYIRPYILLTNSQLIFIEIGMAALIYGLGRKFFLGRGLFKTDFWLIINTLLGYAPSILFLLFWSSLYLNFHDIESEHEIESRDTYYTKSKKGTTRVHSFVYHLNDKFLDEYPEARTIFIEDIIPENFPEHPKLKFKIATSIFGYSVVTDKQLIEAHEYSGY
jgi:uncharacterized membrane protein YqaE (UPF0057 family)